MDDRSRQISESLRFRRADVADVQAVAAILKAAARRMLAEGKQQWDESYPTETHVRADVENRVGYVLEQDGAVVGYAAVVFTGEPAYDDLYGQWLSDERYVVVHRVAVAQDGQRTGLGRALMTAVEDYARSLGIRSFRIDTNYNNYAMLGLLEKLGFAYCGEVRYDRGSRKAFEKLLSPVQDDFTENKFFE